jgi:molybdenum cofactor cytidylyltransferase
MACARALRCLVNPQMPDAKSSGPRVAAVVLAAGLSTRMGANKLLADLCGEPLVRRVVRSAEASRARPVVVVTGFDHKPLEAAVGDAECTIVHNPDFRHGLSTSLRTGIVAVGECDGAVILLGDMPAVSPLLIDKMILAFDPQNGRTICVPTVNGRRGNPVLFGGRFFPELEKISGDVGARAVVMSHPECVCEVEADDDGPLTDIDTPEDLERFVGRA